MQNKGKGFLPGDRIAARKKQIRNWTILILLVILAVVGVRVLSGMGQTSEITAALMPCYAHQDVTVFGNNVLYYDGASIHCVSGSGSILWSFQIGDNAAFSTSNTHIVAWCDSQLYILDQNGKSSYKYNLDSPVQFARIGQSYAVAVIGEDTEPEILVKDLQGAQIDTIDPEVFSGMLMLDAGFYGEGGQYMWTLAMDTYGPAISTKMNLFQVGKMNLGIVSLGDNLAYKVLFENNKLHVYTTQQMYTYDYRGVQDADDTMLVYGWRLIDAHVPARGDAPMLMAPTAQTNSIQSITELRVLQGSLDRRYTLPSACVGAAIQGSNLYAFASSYLYRTNIDSQRFYAYALPLPEGQKATTFVGLTSGGRGIVTSGDYVYSIALPK